MKALLKSEQWAETPAAAAGALVEQCQRAVYLEAASVGSAAASAEKMLTCLLKPMAPPRTAGRCLGQAALHREKPSHAQRLHELPMQHPRIKTGTTSLSANLLMGYVHHCR